jgi:hypothetical protein
MHLLGSGAAKIGFLIKSILAARSYGIYRKLILHVPNLCKFDFTCLAFCVKLNAGDDVYTDLCTDMYI